MKALLATGIFPPDIGGPATYAKLLADELPKRGSSVRVESFGAVRRWPVGIRHLAYLFRLLWHGRDADVVFAQDTVSVGLPALVAAYVLGKPFIVRVPGDYAWEQAAQRFGVPDGIVEFQKKKYGFRTELLRRIQRAVVNGADSVIAPSEAFKAIVAGWMRDAGKTRAIYNGIDIAEIERAAAGASPRPKTLISAGRLVHWKGFDALIRMMKQLPGWSLEIAGDGPDRARLEKLIEAEGLRGRVILLGRMDRAELVKRLASSWAFVFHSGFESFSFQAVEAMAAGVPVVVAGAAGLSEVFDGSAMSIVSSADGFVAAVKALGDNPLLRSERATKGREAAKKFSIGATLDQLESLIGGVAAAHPERSKKRLKAAKLVRYLFSGGMAAVTNLVLLWLFTSVLHIWYLVSSVLAFLIAFGVSFVLQKFFTFQDHATEGIRGQAAAYFGVTGTNLLINTGLMYLFVDIFRMNYLVAQIVASVLIAVEGYVVYNIFIFKKK